MPHTMFYKTQSSFGSDWYISMDSLPVFTHGIISVKKELLCYNSNNGSWCISIYQLFISLVLYLMKCFLFESLNWTYSFCDMKYISMYSPWNRMYDIGKVFYDLNVYLHLRVLVYCLPMSILKFWETNN